MGKLLRIRVRAPDGNTVNLVPATVDKGLDLFKDLAESRDTTEVTLTAGEPHTHCSRCGYVLDDPALAGPEGRCDDCRQETS